MDQGGDMAWSSEILYLLDNYDYTVRMTTAEIPQHNYPDERSHGYIVEVLWIFVEYYDVLLKLWPY